MFTEDLLTLDTVSPPCSLTELSFYVILEGEVPCYGGLRLDLNNPGDRKNNERIMKVIGAKKVCPEVYFTNAWLPFVIPSALDETNEPPATLNTVRIKPGAKTANIIYNYADHWKTKGDEKVLEDLFEFGGFDFHDKEVSLIHGFMFKPNGTTFCLGTTHGQKVYRSVIERNVTQPVHGVDALFEVIYDVNQKKEPLSFTIRYWLHNKTNPIGHGFWGWGRASPHAEFQLTKGAGGEIMYSGHAGRVRLNVDFIYRPWGVFTLDGFIANPDSGKTYISSKGRALRCDMSKTLRNLVDIATGYRPLDVHDLGHLDYLVIK